jgi:hypothetical protein
MNIFSKEKKTISKEVRLLKSDDGIYSVSVGGSELKNTFTTDINTARVFFKRAIEMLKGEDSYHSYEVIDCYTHTITL